MGLKHASACIRHTWVTFWIRTRSDESLASIQKMAQFMGRAESTTPIVEDLAKQLSMVPTHGLQPSRLIHRLTAEVGLGKMVDISVRGQPEIARPATWSEFLELAQFNEEAACSFLACFSRMYRPLQIQMLGPF